MPFHVYKEVLQLFFNLYEKENIKGVVAYNKMLNSLLNKSK